MITEVRAFEGGYCRQLLGLIDRRSWRFVKFPAVFLALHHAREGWILVDTGYGDGFSCATRRFPFRFYRWATPAASAGRTSDLLAAAGIPLDSIRHVVVTHFHADHVGGLAEFPHTRVHFHAEALAPLQQLKPSHQVRSAFLPALIPTWLASQGHAISESEFSTPEDLPFRTHDLFQDGSIRLVDLPGHAPGQVGVLFQSPAGADFYAADAYWRACQLADNAELLWPASRLQWDPAAYRRTIAQLRDIARNGRHRITCCHDDGTAARLNSRDSR